MPVIFCFILISLEKRMGRNSRLRTLSPQRRFISSIIFGRCLEVASQLGRFFCGMLCLERYSRVANGIKNAHQTEERRQQVPSFNLIFPFGVWDRRELCLTLLFHNIPSILMSAITFSPTQNWSCDSSTTASVVGSLVAIMSSASNAMTSSSGVV